MTNGSKSAQKGILLLAALMLNVPARADVMETQHLFEASGPLGRRGDVTLHSRFRTRPNSLGFYQGRVGPILSVKVWKQVSLIAGYYYQQQQSEADGEFSPGHRLFGGAELDVWASRTVELDTRVLAERFALEDTPNYNRYRWRFRAGARGRFAPYTSNEVFWDADGWRGNRISGGVRWSFRKAWQVDFGYFYEHRRDDVGANRQMWITGLHWRPSARRKGDADP
jgi:hypothetical protein